jgi:uncharacterized protein YggU (UPF0235/DUF167 family)
MDRSGPMARIFLWVKPGRRTDAIGWDPWRSRWVVSCRASPTSGRANRAVALLVADWLGLPRTAVSWGKAGSSHAKELSVIGITDTEAARRLRAHVTAPTGKPEPP